MNNIYSFPIYKQVGDELWFGSRITTYDNHGKKTITEEWYTVMSHE